MRTRIVAAWALVLTHALVAVSGCSPGTPQDIANAVRTGNVEAVKAELARDPARVHTKVFPQAYERFDQQRDYQARYGRSPWEGRYLIHDAVARGDLRILDALAVAGADLNVRLDGRSLLHLAARDGNLEVATWLLDRGADVNAINDCTSACPQLGETPLHDAQALRADDMSALLLARGARVDTVGANGRSALHVAADDGRLGGAFVLCRHGADPSRPDAAGKTPYDLSRTPTRKRDAQLVRAEDEALLTQWLKPNGGCAIVAAKARSNGSPVSDDDARTVFTETVAR